MTPWSNCLFVLEVESFMSLTKRRKPRMLEAFLVTQPLANQKHSVTLLLLQ